MRPSLFRRTGLVAGMLIVGLVAGLFGNLGTARAVGSVSADADRLAGRAAPRIATAVVEDQPVAVR